MNFELMMNLHKMNEMEKQKKIIVLFIKMNEYSKSKLA